MEGKHYWLTQTLPIRTKDLIHAKLAVNLMLAIPSMIIASAILMFAIRPMGLDILWLFLVPVVYAVFGSILGLFINMKTPMLHWDHEAQPVKQGKSVLIMMMVGFPTAIAPAAPIFIFGGIVAHILVALTVAVLILLSFLMYRKLCALRLTQLAED